MGKPMMIRCPHRCGMFREDLGLLVCRPRGVLTSDRAEDIVLCRDCLRTAGWPNIHRYHDLTQITQVKLHFHDMMHVAMSEAKLRKGRPQVKACYLVPNQLLYGMIRMYQELIAWRGVEVHVSYDLSALATVLGVDAERLAS
jgi:hypothetical protein